QRASERFGVPPAALRVEDGLVTAPGRSGLRASYGELAAAPLSETLKVSGQGFGLNAEGAARPKDPSSYRVVGTPVPRRDLADKVFGRYTFVTDVRVPGMLHGRVIRPAGIGARLLGVDDRAAREIPGFVRVVVRGDFVGVVAETEWAA